MTPPKINAENYGGAEFNPDSRRGKESSGNSGTFAAI